MYERSHQIEQLYLQRSGVELWRGVLRIPQAEEFQQEKQRLLGGRNRLEPGDHTVARHLDGVLDPNGKNIAQQFQHRLKRGGLRVRQHASLVNANPLPPTLLGELKTQTALADAGVANDSDHPAITPGGICQFKLESGELLASPDQGT